jgi:hypothetical protein
MESIVAHYLHGKSTNFGDGNTARHTKYWW